MNDGDRRPNVVFLITACIVIGLAMIVVGILTRELIGAFLSWLVVSVGMLIGILPPALWRRNRDRQHR